MVESCSDTVGVLFEAELARACSPEEAGLSCLSGLEDEWHLCSGQGEAHEAGRSVGSVQNRFGAARQSGSKVGPREGGAAQCAPAPLFDSREDPLGGVGGVAELVWEAAAPRREEAPGLTHSVWSLDELAEEWYDMSRIVKDREPSEVEACLAGAASR